MSRLLMLPSSGREALEHFEDTVENGISLSSLKDFVDDETFQTLQSTELKKDLNRKRHS